MSQGVSDPCVPDLAPTKMSPWATPPRGAGTGYFWQLFCPLCLTHTGSQVPWGGRAAGERLSFTLTQLLQEAFLSLVLPFILDRSFSSGGGGRGVGEG